MTTRFSVIAAVSVLAGCTSLQPAPTEAISKLPVVRVGDQPPVNSDYVVLYPAGYAFPIKLRASGSLFSAEKQIESQATLSKDLYLYKYWASHDQIAWKNAHTLLGVEFSGGFDVTGIRVNVKVEAK